MINKHFKKVSSATSLVAIGVAIAASLSGCEQKSDESAKLENIQKNGATVYIQETAKGQYKITDEHPSEQTRVILRDINGTERILTQAEIDALVAKEAQKIDNNTSALTYDQARRTTYQSPSVYAKSNENFNKNGSTQPNKSAKSGYFAQQIPSTITDNMSKFVAHRII